MSVLRCRIVSVFFSLVSLAVGDKICIFAQRKIHFCIKVHNFLVIHTMRKKILSLIACLGMGMACYAQVAEPLWMRGGVISPDGNSIAFSYMGNIYTVPSAGGEAKQLTTNASYDGHPMWSPDGSMQAFCSNREGSLDVFIMSATGGKAERVTTHSFNEYPAGWLGNDTLLIRRAGNPTVSELTFPGGTFTRLYKVCRPYPWIM